jgi:DNA mismatch endonuclease Vsr
MFDRLDQAGRSRLMALIRSRDTAPEMRVRRLLFSLGYRYRTHARDLPGRPDIVFRRRRRVVFVHGCFWHAHACGRAGRPRVRRNWWAAKFARNRARDRRDLAALRALAWRALVVWECETRDAGALAARLVRFLGAPRFVDARP